MPVKTIKLPEPLTDSDKIFMERLMAAREKREVITVNGREIQVIRGPRTPRGDVEVKRYSF